MRENNELDADGVEIDEEEADATRRLLENMGAEYETELEELKASVIE